MKKCNESRRVVSSNPGANRRTPTASGVDEAFLKPYGSDSQYARNGEIEEIDFSDRWERKLEGGTVRVTDKPNKDLKQVKKMEKTAEAHARLGIYCEEVGWFEDWMIPAYQKLINEEFNGLDISEEFSDLPKEEFNELDIDEDFDAEIESLTTISAAPPDFTNDDWDVLKEVARLVKLGQTHAEKRVHYTGLDAWEVPLVRGSTESQSRRGGGHPGRSRSGRHDA